MALKIHRRSFLTAAVALPICLQNAASQTPNTETEPKMIQKVQISFAQQSFGATLQDNPTAWDLLRLLPLTLKIEDYGTNEKIIYLPEKLTVAGARTIESPAAGDICYFAPWGNLALYHGSYGNYPGLIRIGKLDDGPAPLLTTGTFAVELSVIS